MFRKQFFSGIILPTGLGVTISGVLITVTAVSFPIALTVGTIGMAGGVIVHIVARNEAYQEMQEMNAAYVSSEKKTTQSDSSQEVALGEKRDSTMKEENKFKVGLKTVNGVEENIPEKIVALEQTIQKAERKNEASQTEIETLKISLQQLKDEFEAHKRVSNNNFFDLQRTRNNETMKTFAPKPMSTPGIQQGSPLVTNSVFSGSQASNLIPSTASAAAENSSATEVVSAVPVP